MAPPVPIVLSEITAVCDVPSVMSRSPIDELMNNDPSAALASPPLRPDPTQAT